MIRRVTAGTKGPYRTGFTSSTRFAESAPIAKSGGFAMQKDEILFFSGGLKSDA